MALGTLTATVAASVTCAAVAGLTIDGAPSFGAGEIGSLTARAIDSDVGVVIIASVWTSAPFGTRQR